MHSDDIWLIDDDSDDPGIIDDILAELRLPNKLVVFSSASAVLQALQHVQHAPFLILCDVNLPAMDGFELRSEMLKRPGKQFHSVPFIYWSSVASESQVKKAYELAAHGFFIKETSFKEMKDTITQIIQYWQKSKMPAK